VSPVSRTFVLRLLVPLLTLAFVPACGKKGPPLPPLSNRPRAPEAVSARRQGDQVQIRFTIPRANQSGVQPANLERVDVYALTGPKLTATRFLDHATVVASVLVRRPPPPDGEPETARTPEDPSALEQGAQAVVTESLTPGAFQPVAASEKARRDSAAPRASFTVLRRTPLVPPDIGVPIKGPPVRYYAVVGVNRGGRRGALSSQIGVALDPAPPAPPEPVAQVGERSVTLTWAAPRGLRGSSQVASEPDETSSETENAKHTVASSARSPRVLSSRSFQPWPSVRSGYNVYVVPPATGQRASTSPYAAASLPGLLNPRPLSSPKFADSGLEFGQERCYVLRTVESAGTFTAESAPSPQTCVKVVDVFPPAAPRGLAAVATEGSINLIWEPNTDRDLAGYVVLRSDQAEGPLEAVIVKPIRETTWRDTTVKSGVRYRYAVVALDTASPPNRSEPSNPVEASIQ
jgi:predicted small lipoprotein YifL